MGSTTFARERFDVAVCGWCQEHPDSPCPACNARRRRAVRLVEDVGLSVTEAARRMGLPSGRVERLLEEEADRRLLAEFRQSHVANESLRRRFLQRRLIDPDFTTSELARRVGTSPIQVERWLGLQPTAPKTDRRGRTYPGRVLSMITVDAAGRLARAMGYAPCEFEGCWSLAMMGNDVVPVPHGCGGYATSEGWHQVRAERDDAGRWQVLDVAGARVVLVETLTGHDDRLAQAEALARDYASEQAAYHDGRRFSDPLPLPKLVHTPGHAPLLDADPRSATATRAGACR
jgi:hypothetical protein